MDKDINYELQQLNPWWLQPELIQNDDKLLEFKAQKWQNWPDFYYKYPLNKDAIFIMRGPRQIGKTTLLKLLIRKLLLDIKVPKEAVFYYSLDRVADYNELFDLIKTYLDFARPRIKGRIYLFLDEVTFVQGWVRAIKDLADRGLLKKATLLLAGSNILELTASGERLPGRRGQLSAPDINLHPLHFGEFLKVVKPELVQLKPSELFQLHFPVLQKYFSDYLLTGGFIFNINQYYQKGFLPAYAYEMLTSWVLGDMFKLNRSENFTLELLGQIPKYLTSKVSFAKLAQSAGMISGATAAEYVELLERMFVLFKLPYLSLEQKRRSAKKNIKIYFQDPFILAALLAKSEGVLNDAFRYAQNYCQAEFLPKMAELLVGALLLRYFPDRLYYGMSQEKEIDFVGRYGKEWHYFEVKYQTRIQAKEVHLPKILANSNITIVTKDAFSRNKNLTLVPLPLFLALPQKFILLDYHKSP